MKRKSFLLSFAVLIVVLFLGVSLSAGAVVTDEAKNLRFIGASPGGTFFIVLGGLSECVSKNIPKWVVTVEPGTAMSDIVRIAQGDGDLGLSQNNVILDEIRKGEAGSEKIASLGAIATSAAQLVVLKSTGLTTFDEFIEKKPKLRLSWGPPSEVHYVAAQRLFGEYGLVVEDFVKWGGNISYKEMGEAADMVASGASDGYFLIALTPTAPTTELSLNRELTLLTVSDDIIDKLVEKYNYLKITLPAATYNFIDKPTNVFAAKSITVVSTDMPEEVAYNIVKSVLDNLDYFKNLHAILKNINIDYMIDTGGVPLHPGAVRAYQEFGANIK
jgi:TRAP transporter TAXI family solute receptor